MSEYTRARSSGGISARPSPAGRDCAPIALCRSPRGCDTAGSGGADDDVSEEADDSDAPDGGILHDRRHGDDRADRGRHEMQRPEHPPDLRVDADGVPSICDEPDSCDERRDRRQRAAQADLGHVPATEGPGEDDDRRDEREREARDVRDRQKAAPPVRGALREVAPRLGRARNTPSPGAARGCRGALWPRASTSRSASTRRPTARTSSPVRRSCPPGPIVGVRALDEAPRVERRCRVRSDAIDPHRGEDALGTDRARDDRRARHRRHRREERHSGGHEQPADAAPVLVGDHRRRAAEPQTFRLQQPHLRRQESRRATGTPAAPRA